MSTQLASVEPALEVDEPERDEHGLEKLMTIAEFAKAEGISLKTAYAGFKHKGWPFRDGPGSMKVSREDRIEIREMSRRVNEPKPDVPAHTKPRRRQPRRRRSAA